MKKTAITLMLISIFSKFFGFARDVTLSYFYGASNISDAYLISTAIPEALFGFISAGIVTSYIPMYCRIENTEGVNGGNRYTNNLINITLITASIIVILALLYVKPIVRVFASGFDEETFLLTVAFTRISLFSIFFTGLISIFSGYLQIKENYLVPALIGLPMNLVIILSIFISTRNNSLVLSLGFVTASLIQILFMLPFTYKSGYKYKKLLDVKDTHIKNMILIALPVILGISVNQINVLVDRTLASRIAIGGISALNYANRLNLFVQGIFVLSISTVLYPILSKLVTEKNMDGLKTSLSEAITGINLLVIPATIGFMAFASQIVSLLFERGAFNSNSVLLTSQALFYYSIGMIGFGLREVLSRTFFSLQDTKTPMINASISLILNIILNIILSKYLGVGGLALATSISAIFAVVLLFVSLEKKIGSFDIKCIAVSFIKILCASIFMGILARGVFNLLINIMSQNFALIISIGIGAIIYFIVIYFMKIEDVDNIIRNIRHRVQRH